MPGPMEWIIIAALGLLIFGKRLPEVGRSLGKGIVEFKKGLNSIGDDIEQVDTPSTPARTALPDQDHATLPQGKQPRFDPHTGKPLQPQFDPYTGKPLAQSSQVETPAGSSDQSA
jgi:sec-independent protein translocase protein TatA